MFKHKKKKKPGGKQIKKPDESPSESDVENSQAGSDSEVDEKGSDDHATEWGKKVEENLRKYISTSTSTTLLVHPIHLVLPVRCPQ
jgi:hypothetical protein